MLGPNDEDPLQFFSQGAAPMPPAASPASANANNDLMIQNMRLAKILAPHGMKSRELERQQKYADALRGTKAPEGLNPTGKVYTAANPMEFIGAGINRLRGETEQGRIEGERGKAMTGLGGKLDEAVQQAMDEQERERKRRQMMMMQQQGGAPVQSANIGEF